MNFLVASLIFESFVAYEKAVIFCVLQEINQQRTGTDGLGTKSSGLEMLKVKAV